jgi:hypothetical protein
MRYLAIICFVLSFLGCDKAPIGNTAQDREKLEFNKSDKSIETNGNISVAVGKYQENSSNLVAEKVSISNLTKSPYSNIGNFVLVKGHVYKIEEQPPNPNYPGKVTEVLMLAEDNNSPLGATMIDCLCIGDTTHIESNSEAACGGYFVGTYQSANSMGGTVEAFTIIGNIAHDRN